MHNTKFHKNPFVHSSIIHRYQQADVTKLAGTHYCKTAHTINLQCAGIKKQVKTFSKIKEK